jgi:magnesium transporter
VTSPNLELVRRLKNRLVRLTTRVETVREVLERFLDDDEDMHDLNLTANYEPEEEEDAAAAAAAAAAATAPQHMGGSGDGLNGGGGVLVGGNAAGGRETSKVGVVGGGASQLPAALQPVYSGGGLGGSGGLMGGGGGGKRVSATTGRSLPSSVSTNSSVMESEVAEVEMLLEAYFMHFDNTYNRLTTLNEYIKDTEDLVRRRLMCKFYAGFSSCVCKETE